MKLNERALFLKDRVRELYAEAVTVVSEMAERRLLDAHGNRFESRVTDRLAPLDKAEIQIFVAGPQRIGKSTLLNAISGAHLATGSGSSVTGVLTMLRHHDAAPLARVHFRHRGRRPEEFNPDSSPELLRDYTTVKGRYVAEVDFVEVLRKDENLRGLCLVDAPGINDIDERRSEIGQRFGPTAHALIFVFSAQATLSRHDLDFLRAFYHHAPSGGWQDTFFVINRVDELVIPSNDDPLQWEHVADVESNAREALSGAFATWPGSPRIFPLAAYFAGRTINDVRKNRKYGLLRDDEIEEISRGFTTFYDQLRTHVSRPEVQDRFFRKPIEQLLAVAHDISTYLERLKADSMGTEAELMAKAISYRRMTGHLSDGLRRIKDECRSSLLRINKTVVVRFDEACVDLENRVSDLLADRLEAVVQEQARTLEKLDRRALVLEIQRLYEDRVIRPEHDNIQQLIYDNMLRPIQTLQRETSDLTKRLRMEARNLLQDDAFEGVFAGVSFAEIDPEEMAEHMLGGFAASINDDELFERRSNRDAGAATGAVLGGVLGGVVGGLLLGPLGAVVGVVATGAGGAVAGDNLGSDWDVLRPDWVRRVRRSARAELAKRIKQEFENYRSELVDQPFVGAQQAVVNGYLEPLKQRANDHLEQLSRALMEFESHRTTVNQRIATISPFLERVRVLSDRAKHALTTHGGPDVP